MKKVKAKRTLQERLIFDDKDLKTPLHDEISWWLDDSIKEFLFGDKNELRQYLSEQADTMKEAVEQQIVQQGFTVADVLSYTLEEKAIEYEQLGKQRWDISSDKYSKIRRQEIFRRRAKLMETREVKLYLLQPLLAEADKIAELPLEKLFPQIVDKIWEYPIKNKKDEVIGFVDMKVVYEQPVISIHTGGVGPTWELTNRRMSICFEIKSSIRSLGELIRQIHLYQNYETATFVVVSPDDRFVDKIRSQGIGFQKYSLGTEGVDKLL